MATFLKDEKRDRFATNFKSFCGSIASSISTLSTIKTNITALRGAMDTADFIDDDRTQVQGIIDAIAAAQPSVVALNNAAKAVVDY